MDAETGRGLMLWGRGGGIVRSGFLSLEIIIRYINQLFVVYWDSNIAVQSGEEREECGSQ
jgi:hypothetical protein